MMLNLGSSLRWNDAADLKTVIPAKAGIQVGCGPLSMLRQRVLNLRSSLRWNDAADLKTVIPAKAGIQVGCGPLSMLRQ